MEPIPTQNPQSNSPQDPPNPFPIFKTILILSLILLAASLFYFGHQLSFSGSFSPNPTPTSTSLPSDEALPTPSDITESWKTYTNPKLGFEFKYPPSLEKFGKLTEKYQPSESGFNYCLKPTKEASSKFLNHVYAGGGGCFTDTFAVSANSFDYERGTESSFLDFHGYEKEGTDIRVRGYSTLGDAIPKSFYKIITNQNGVEIVKIYGQPTDPNNPFRNDHPGEGFIGALINTQSKNYPGIALTANSKTTATEEVFDQILSTIKIFSAEETVLPYINYDYQWKNYVSKDLFAISYLKDGYYVREDKDRLGIRFIISNMNPNEQISAMLQEGYSVSINVIYNMGRNYYDELLRGRYPNAENYTREKSVLSGIEFDKFTTKTKEYNFPYSFREEYYVLRGIKYYEISISGRSKTEDLLPKAEQILSTFKFLN